jgi:hypothetical protein
MITKEAISLKARIVKGHLQEINDDSLIKEYYESKTIFWIFIEY